ncbi:hypothetical protein [uncultured Roseobacter sp.]|uniref:hypothetical protein n=1 Tax=uncultured Roseobacter sp. TaxID=114847 RepID=UPI00261D83CA|nr:hypothetical protein [uncultured Roseobacter sp.]
MFELTSLLAALETSTLADWVGGPIYPVISALHILTFAFVVVPVLMADVRVLKIGVADDQVARLSRTVVLAFTGAAFTGFLLLSVQATRYAENPAIFWKFGFLALAGANAVLFYLLEKVQRIIAVVSVLVWCGVLLAGRWIAFSA